MTMLTPNDIVRHADEPDTLFLVTGVAKHYSDSTLSTVDLRELGGALGIGNVPVQKVSLVCTGYWLREHLIPQTGLADAIRVRHDIPYTPPTWV